MMPLPQRARAVRPPEDVAPCWPLVLRAIEAGFFDEDALRTTLEQLGRGEDYIVEDLSLEHIDGRLRVTFLDEQLWCPPQSLRALLEQLA